MTRIHYYHVYSCLIEPVCLDEKPCRGIMCHYCTPPEQYNRKDGFDDRPYIYSQLITKYPACNDLALHNTLGVGRCMAVHRDGWQYF